MRDLISEARIAAEAEYRMSEQARRDALRHMLAVLPDPRDYAYSLDADVVAALVSAYRHQSYGFVVDSTFDALLPQMRRLGLVGFSNDKRKGRGLTAFGWSVRCALREMDA